VADALDLAGYETRLPGADVSIASLINVLEQESPNLLALSLTMPGVRDHSGGRLPIVVGGMT